jgi:hypothetical protein
MGAQYGRPSTAGHSGQWLSAVVSLTVGAAFFSLWFWLLPRALVWRSPAIDALGSLELEPVLVAEARRR